MFRGLTRSIIIVSVFMLGLPAAMMLAMDGGDWLERFRLMSPIF
ncbi:hypothetical protein [Lutimaribacter degradans]|nr:hypothetical protein [Lutimaribacter sp. EGI FJ00013]